MWALTVAAVLALLAGGGPAGVKTFLAWSVAAVLAVLGCLFAYWANCIRTMAYIVDRDTLTITWGPHRHVIPIASIQRLVPGRTLDEARVDGLNWWGCHVGVADVKRIGVTLVYSTHGSPGEILYVVTSEGAFAFTVLDQAAFAEEVQARAALGPVRASPTSSFASGGIAAFSFWSDAIAVAAAGVLIALTIALAGYLSWKYPGLPEVIQLNFPALGGIVRVGDKSELLRVVYLGLGVLGVNLVLGLVAHPWERAASIWFLASGGMIQCILLAAAIVAVQSS